jgi:hypothetical protein
MPLRLGLLASLASPPEGQQQDGWPKHGVDNVLGATAQVRLNLSMMPSIQPFVDYLQTQERHSRQPTGSATAQHKHGRQVERQSDVDV